MWRRGQTSLAGDKQNPPLRRDKRARLALFTEPQGAPAQVAKHLGVVCVPEDLGAHAGGHDVATCHLVDLARFGRDDRKEVSHPGDLPLGASSAATAWA